MTIQGISRFILIYYDCSKIVGFWVRRNIFPSLNILTAGIQASFSCPLLCCERAIYIFFTCQSCMKSPDSLTFAVWFSFRWALNFINFNLIQYLTLISKVIYLHDVEVCCTSEAIQQTKRFQWCSLKRAHIELMANKKLEKQILVFKETVRPKIKTFFLLSVVLFISLDCFGVSCLVLEISAVEI